MGAGIGAYLERQRRLRGLSLEDLAALTRIPQRSLERLEAGHFDATPDGFARGFVRTVAQAIGLDPDETVNRMRPEPSEPRRAHRSPDRHRLVWLALIASASLGGVLALRSLAGAGVGAADPPGARQVQAPPVRRDAVRALAERSGLLPGPADRPPAGLR